jgi:hypothetical protein
VKQDRAQLVAADVRRGDETVEGDVAQRVCTDRAPDLLDRQPLAISSARLAKSMP